LLLPSPPSVFALVVVCVSSLPTQEFLIGLEKMVMEEYCEDEEVRGAVCVCTCA
jgi:hypothetical protein